MLPVLHFISDMYVLFEIIQIEHYCLDYWFKAKPFLKAIWGRMKCFGGVRNSAIQMFWPLYLHMLNSKLHLEPPCANPSSHIRNYFLGPPPPLPVTFENGIGLRYNGNLESMKHVIAENLVPTTFHNRFNMSVF